MANMFLAQLGYVVGIRIKIHSLLRADTLVSVYTIRQFHLSARIVHEGHIKQTSMSKCTPGMHTHTHTHTCVRMYTHTHTHIHTHAKVCFLPNACLQPSFIGMLGLQQSLTPSRNNGFLNMFKLMQRKTLEMAASALKQQVCGCGCGCGRGCGCGCGCGHGCGHGCG